MMNENRSLTAVKLVMINAPVSKVWNAITSDASVENFMLGMKPETNWQKDSFLNWTGGHQGEEHHVAKGKIIQMIPERILEYTFFYTGYDHADIAEHYQIVRFEISKVSERAIQLQVKQGDYAVFEGGETYLQHANNFWQQALQKLKAYCEA